MKKLKKVKKMKKNFGLTLKTKPPLYALMKILIVKNIKTGLKSTDLNVQDYLLDLTALPLTNSI